jgi:hypothetical protein
MAPPSIRGLPAVALVLLVLGIGVALVELWPVANAWWIGATEWWADIPGLLPVAARAAAMLMLPAAVAWATPDVARRNAWLWKGALIVAVVQLLRYPADALTGWLYSTVPGGLDPSDPMATVVGLGIALVLAAGSVLGIWALGEGLKDAGGRSQLAVVIALVVALAFGMLLGIPTVMAGVEPGLDMVTATLSLVLNVLFLFVEGLLAGRAVAGALAHARPTGAWRAGGVGGVVLWLLPTLSLVTLLVNSFLLADSAPLAIPYLGVATYFGWPLFAVALAMGMGRLAVPVPSALGTGFLVRGTARFVHP